jgi:hypothetical protein
MLTLRLPKVLERGLARAAKQAGTTKSEYVRHCIEKSLAQPMTLAEAHEMGKDLFGTYGSGRSDLSQNAKQIVREKTHAKACRDRLRSGRVSVRSQ